MQTVAPVVVVALMWTLAIALSLGDAPEVLRGARPMGAALASFLLCVTRAGVGLAVLGAPVGRAPARFAAWSEGASSRATLRDSRA